MRVSLQPALSANTTVGTKDRRSAFQASTKSFREREPKKRKQRERQREKDRKQEKQEEKKKANQKEKRKKKNRKRKKKRDKKNEKEHKKKKNKKKQVKKQDDGGLKMEDGRLKKTVVQQNNLGQNAP